MKIIKTIAEMSSASSGAIAAGKKIGFVPTMGYLHEGHLSLMRLSKAETDVSVVSIFVNPTQFGPKEDFAKYPRDTEGDLAKCRGEGVDIVFMPEAADMYPRGYATYVDVERVSDGLCGSRRPGHFRGVATVVAKLFNIVKPHRAFFGQKDYQQTVVIRRMVADLNMGVEVVVAPTVREADGLAMSSRNAYLSERERAVAPLLYKALSRAREMHSAGEDDAAVLIKEAAETLAAEPMVEIEYIDVVDADTLLPLDYISGPAVMAAAVRLGRTRLIDNILLERT